MNKNLLFEQQRKVKTILWTGKISIKTREEELDAEIIVVGKKIPLKLRIEVTNWLTGPIFYVFIEERKVTVFSIKEKKVYITDLKNLGSLHFIPHSLKPMQIWSILRGLPVSYDKSKLDIKFENYKIEKGYVFAQDITVNSLVTGTVWHLRIRHIEFNRKVHENVFYLNIPPEFQVIRYLDQTP